MTPLKWVFFLINQWRCEIFNVTCLSAQTGSSGSLGSLLHDSKTSSVSDIKHIKLTNMVTDVQLAIFANILGVSLFLLVVLYHYVAVNNPKKQD
ncbi:hypothetical protein WMY93_015762 [Mugilogobius chulae]|uniref:Dolichyl-diphosphooligosaccharide--protein glycosyltransferase subunit 4 n=1 Tax=Mugilogobius chulae TaxID=88201 RepID=A0AAW0NY53_9GOBI